MKISCIERLDETYSTTQPQPLCMFHFSTLGLGLVFAVVHFLHWFAEHTPC